MYPLSKERVIIEFDLAPRAMSSIEMRSIDTVLERLTKMLSTHLPIFLILSESEFVFSYWM